jgi:hypothetical protein
MAYGQTGPGKTFTLGHLGEDDTSSRGIMVRAMEDILAKISPETDSVSVSYLQVGLTLSERWLYHCMISFYLFFLHLFSDKLNEITSELHHVHFDLVLLQFASSQLT